VSRDVDSPANSDTDNDANKEEEQEEVKPLE